ncbi:MAG: hypothetical protein ABIR08_04615 [Sphingomonas sp.]
MLAAAAPAMTPVDAERAFAADAKTIGQWTAFRKWSTDDAVMFFPQPVNTHEVLKDRKDPPNAIDWWPTASYLSCDGKLAVNTGGWKRPDGTDGYFSTIWVKQPDGGWKWAVDGGDKLAAARPRPASVKSVRAACSGKVGLKSAARDSGEGARASADQTLTAKYTVAADGARRFTAKTWDGRAYRTVIDDQIAAPPGK